MIVKLNHFPKFRDDLKKTPPDLDINKMLFLGGGTGGELPALLSEGGTLPRSTRKKHFDKTPVRKRNLFDTPGV